MKVPRVLLDKLPQTHRSYLEQTLKVLDGNVSFGSSLDNVGLDRNIESFLLTGTTPGIANTQFLVSHNLRRLPTGFLVIRLDQAGIIYADAADIAAWSATMFAAKCNLASVNYRIQLI